MMKTQYSVSMLGTFPPIRALSSYCYELAHAIAKKCRVEFISFKSIYPSFLYPGGKPDDDNTYPAIFTDQILVRRRLAWYNPASWLTEGVTAKGNLLHAQWWSAPLFPIYLVVCACFKLKKRPVVFTVHNVLPHEKSSLYFHLSRILYELGDHFIVHSDINKRQMAECYDIPLSMISVIPHGSLDFHVKKGADRELLRKEMQIAPKNKVILCFGAIRPYKGLDTALRAFPRVLEKVPEARLLIAGRLWEDWKPYSQLISKLGIDKYVMTHLEYIPSEEVHKFFEVADLCLFPYHHFDSQSGAGSVAISFRKPMIVSSVGGLPDLVNDKRCVVPPGNHTEFARAMIRCLNDEDMLESMKTDAEGLALQFGWTEIAEKTALIYENLLGRPC